ncbi:MAG: hypothetical protein QXS27_02055 [Candidatus Jordarchaeaceae archaeon]
MRAQVSLTPTESKKLIGKATVKLDAVQKALSKGTIIIHPSTTTSFIMEELGKKTHGVACGVIIPRGTCFALEAIEDFNLAEGIVAPELFMPWVLKNGEMLNKVTYKKALSEIGPDDVYIKTGNALDPQGNVGVLIGSRAGGTVGVAYMVCRARGTHIILPIGLEKLIPIPVREASREAGIERMDYSMGLPVGLFPIDGTVITEVEAIKILTGATAIPISAGGIMGAEGAVTLIIKGDEKSVREAIQIVEEVKGAQLAKIKIPECSTCPILKCSLKKKIS